MTTAAAPMLTDEQIRDVVGEASLAPSIHNTQPWRWVTVDGGLDLYVDPARWLRVADPAGRQMLVSCGAALLHARLAIRRLGLVPRVRLCSAGDEGVLSGETPAASIRVVGSKPAGPEERDLAAAMTRRHTDRRPFSSTPVTRETTRLLRAAAELEGAWLVSLVDPDLRIDVAVLTARADWIENHDPSYRAELAGWSRTGHEAPDGIPRDAVVGSAGERPAEFVMRDFEVAGEAGIPLAQTGVERPTVMLVGTVTDRIHDQLAGGQAIARVLLTATVHGLAASPIGQAVDIDGTRHLLTEAISGVGHVQMLIRVGYPLPGSAPLPATPRRSVEDVLADRADGDS